MSTTELIELINNLPSDKQKEVEKYVSSLINGTKSENSKTNRGYGSMKGLIKYMANDFDAPLEDFKDYM